MRKFLALVASLGLTLFAFATVASAHTGSVVASEDCESFLVVVSLDANVAEAATWEVTTTIPDTVGGSGTGPGPADVKTYSGPAPASGTVTLEITFGEEHKLYSESIKPADDCEPSIQIRKGHDAEGTVAPGSKVTYTYEVENTGDTPLSNVDVSDRISDSDAVACAPVDYASGDIIDNSILDVEETWLFNCSTNLEVTTANEACVAANFGDAKVENCDTAEVEVSPTPELVVHAGTGTPSPTPELGVHAGTGTPGANLGDTSQNGNGSNPLPTVIFSVVLLASLTALAYANVKLAKGTRPIR